MLSVSRQTDYAVRIVLHLASHQEGGRVSIANMAKDRHLPIPFVRRIVSRLVKAGIVKTVRGTGGGITLAGNVLELTLGDVVAAIEGPAYPSPCHAEPRHCILSKGCPVRDVWTNAAKLLDNHLKSVFISALVDFPGQGAVPFASVSSQGYSTNA